MDNYFRGDEKEASQILEQHFKEEELEGRMVPMSFKAAVQRCPGSLSGFLFEGGSPGRPRRTGWWSSHHP